MTTNTTPDAVALMQLAKAQANAVDALLRHPALLEDTSFYKELQNASHSVIDCIVESLNNQRPGQFQKAFLVVAKTFNAELRSQAVDCFGKKQLQAEEADSLLQLNKQLESALVLYIQQLQQGVPKGAKKSTAPSAKKLKHKT